MANDAHLRILSDWLAAFGEISCPDPTTGAAVRMYHSVDSIYVEVTDGEGNKATFNLDVPGERETERYVPEVWSI